jgi:hypothetical protein
MARALLLLIAYVCVLCCAVARGNFSPPSILSFTATRDMGGRREALEYCKA